MKISRFIHKVRCVFSQYFKCLKVCGRIWVMNPKNLYLHRVKLIFEVGRGERVKCKIYSSVWPKNLAQGRPQDISQRGARFFRNKTFSGIRNKSKEKGQKLKNKGTKLQAQKRGAWQSSPYLPPPLVPAPDLASNTQCGLETPYCRVPTTTDLQCTKIF